MGIACAVLVILLTQGGAVQKFYPLLTLWCFAPLAWGIWAMLAPSSWVPQRLPIWGAILGAVAGLLAFFVLNMPLRVFGVAAPVIWRGAGVVMIAAVYYLLWMLVRLAHRHLAIPTSVA